MKTGDKYPLILPFFHIYGLSIINAALFNGATIIPFDSFEPDFFLKTIQNHKIEALFLVPTLINFFAKSPLVEKYDLSSVKRVFCGGNCLSEEDVIQLQNRYTFFGNFA